MISLKPMSFSNHTFLSLPTPNFWRFTQLTEQGSPTGHPNARFLATGTHQEFFLKISRALRIKWSKPTFVCDIPWTKILVIQMGVLIKGYEIIPIWMGNILKSSKRVLIAQFTCYRPVVYCWCFVRKSGINSPVMIDSLSHYLEPKWGPLFWSEWGPYFGGLTFKNRVVIWVRGLIEFQQTSKRSSWLAFGISEPSKQ